MPMAEKNRNALVTPEDSAASSRNKPATNGGYRSSTVAVARNQTTTKPAAKRAPTFQFPVPAGSSLREYGLALLAVALALALRLLLDPVLHEDYPYVTFFIAVVAIAAYCGAGPSLFAAVVGYVTAAYCFTPPRYTWIFTGEDLTSGVMYLLASCALTGFGAAQRRARDRVETSAQQVLRERRALDEANQRIAEMLEAMGDSFILLDRNWRHVAVNQKAADLGAMPKSKMVGKTIWELYPESVETPYFRILHRAMEQQRAIAFEWFYAPADIWLETRAYPSSGGLAVYSTDITQRKRAEQARAQLAAIVQSSEDAIVSYNLDGVIQTWNPGADRLYGYTAAEMIGKPMALLYPPEFPELLPSLIGRIRHGEMVPPSDSVRVRKDGSRVDVSATLSPIRDMSGTVVGISSIARDITGRRRAEATLRHNQEEIETLNRQLRTAMAETHHRVKNNLQVIAALVDMQVMKDEASVPTSELVRLGKHIKMLAAIHDLLTQEARSDTELNYVSSAAAVNKLVPMVQAIVGSRRVHYEVEDVHLPVRHGTALAIIINELISNAVKHGKGDIDFTFKVADGVAKLVVEDDGPGFPPDFDPVRASNTGMELIEGVARWDLSGAASYVNRPEGGGRVTVTFPVPQK